MHQKIFAEAKYLLLTRREIRASGPDFPNQSKYKDNTIFWRTSGAPKNVVEKGTPQ